MINTNYAGMATAYAAQSNIQKSTSSPEEVNKTQIDSSAAEINDAQSEPSPRLSFSEIVKKYDMRNISAAGIDQLTLELHDNGLISDENLEMLQAESAELRSSLNKFTTSRGETEPSFSSTSRFDFIDLLDQQIALAKENGQPWAKLDDIRNFARTAEIRSSIPEGGLLA